MKTVSAHITVCSRCGRTYHGLPARSRMDNEAQICPDCGTREALATLGVSEEEQESILDAIHKYSSESIS